MIFFIVYIALVVLMSLTWILYRVLNNPSVVDVGWAMGLMLAGLIYLFHQNLTSLSLLAGGLLMLWAIRLGGYLWFTRIRKGLKDKRYQTLSDQWKIAKSLGFFLNFQLQGILIWILSLPFYFIAQKQGQINAYALIVSILMLLSLLGESLADWQLYHFRQSNKEGVCQTGLWRFSRHPNYFFDWLTWLCFALLALHDPSILAFLSPITLYIIMNHITGPMTEEGSIESKGQRYRDYQQRTNAFFPWIKKD